MSIFISNTAFMERISAMDGLPIIAWRSTLELGDITASGYQNSRPPSNLWGPDTASFWEGAEGEGAGIFIDLANPLGRSVDYIAMARHNLGSDGISYSIYSSTDGSTYSLLTPVREPVDDSPIVEYFNATSASHFQIRFTGSAAPILAHVRMGTALVLPRSIYVGHQPGTLSKVVEGSSQTSSMGQYLGRIVTRTGFKSAVKQENVDPQFVRDEIVPFIAHANGTRRDDGTVRGTFFFAWRPDYYEHEVLYAWTDDEIRPENQRSNGMMSFSFNMNGVA